LGVAAGEGSAVGGHFVEETAEGPDVAFGVVGEVGPQLGTGVKWGSSLRTGKSSLTDFADV
jgi:hypothetical protein